jgi:hypothetical protein
MRFAQARPDGNSKMKKSAGTTPIRLVDDAITSTLAYARRE